VNGRLAIFDCDGTLIDSQHNICAAMEICFAEAGRDPPARDATRRVVGLSLVEAMQIMAPDAGPEAHGALAEGYKRAFHDMRGRGLVDEPLYDGVADTIETLAAEGWLLGIATGKSDRGVALCLEAHGLTDRFVTIQTADRHPSKPHPAMIAQALAETEIGPDQAVMIGDTSYDMAMARAAGVTSIGVAWGYHSPDELKEAGADHLVYRPADLLDIVRNAP